MLNFDPIIMVLTLESDHLGLTYRVYGPSTYFDSVTTWTGSIGKESTNQKVTWEQWIPILLEIWLFAVRTESVVYLTHGSWQYLCIHVKQTLALKKELKDTTLDCLQFTFWLVGLLLGSLVQVVIL